MVKTKAHVPGDEVEAHDLCDEENEASPPAGGPASPHAHRRREAIHGEQEVTHALRNDDADKQQRQILPAVRQRRAQVQRPKRAARVAAGEQRRRRLRRIGVCLAKKQVAQAAVDAVHAKSRHQKRACIVSSAAQRVCRGGACSGGACSRSFLEQRA